MTNGEKIKEIFPNIVVNECAITIHATTKVECCSEKHCKGSISYDFWKEWWNAEYKEPTTKNDLEVDAVSRQAVLDLINADWKYENLEIEINNLPSVTPQERKGHWIKMNPYSWQMHEYECSECGHETDDNTESYCSDCGAKMVGLQESEG